MAFGIVAVAILGIAGLGTEVGGWYVAEMHAQAAADAAAQAGAIALATGNDASAAAASALSVAAQNGFGTGVTVHTPPSSGPNTSNASAVEVIISQPVTLLFAGLFLASTPTVTTRAVAAVQSGGIACAVALSDGAGLSMGGNSTTTGNDCSLASDAAGGTSIAVSGSATVFAYTLNAVGGCSGCSGPSVSLTRPASAYQLPTTNPFAAADAVPVPATFNCTSAPQPAGTGTPPNGYCGDYSLQSQQSLTLTPGTYFFTGSVSFGGGSTVTCPTCTDGAGVTIVLTNSASTLHVDGHATVTLTAPAVNTYNAGYNGLLFYMADGGTPGTVTINGGSTSTLVGGLYFPTESVSFDGNESINPSTCTQIVAETLTVAGNAATTLSSSGCAQSGTATAQLQEVKLLE